MSGLDLFSISVMTTVVVLSAGAVYLVETLLRRDDGAGRIWALAYIAGILTTVSYLAWAASPDESVWLATGIGNASFVASAGIMWLGCRRFNERTVMVPAALVAAASLLAFALVAVAGAEGGDWAGALAVYIPNAAFTLLGAVESRRGTMATLSVSWPLTVVLAIESLFFLARSIAFVAVGPVDPFFTDWFGSIAMAFVTVVLIVVAVVSTSVLRAARPSATPRSRTLALASNGVLDSGSFRVVLRGILDRARHHGDRYALIAMRIDDIPNIATAFSPGEAQALVHEWRSSVVRHAPTQAVVGQASDTEIVLGMVPVSAAEARRVAGRLHRHLLDDFASLGSAVIPVLGVGVALTDGIGYDAERLLQVADRAALRSASSPDASVIVVDMA
ncbi:hypothetical protein ACIGCK_07020 [Microbacterium sp. NPDC078428]|uniref:hypothetical protein n=1 Tax=Microbacterium sp. NPDC078428 TaxID=3364190 RepID=UPI0037CC39D9